MNVKNCRGEDCESNHFMVRIKFKTEGLQLQKRTKRQKLQIHNVAKLKNMEVSIRYCEEIKEFFEDKPFRSVDIEEEWKLEYKQ